MLLFRLRLAILLFLVYRAHDVVKFLNFESMLLDNGFFFSTKLSFDGVQFFLEFLQRVQVRGTPKPESSGIASSNGPVLKPVAWCLGGR